MDDRTAMRRRAARSLFVMVALGTTSVVASFTVVPLIGEDLSRSATLSGIPWATGVLGTALGSAALSQLMARRGRAPGLALGYLLAAVGGVLAIVATKAGQFGLLIPASMLLGTGNAANHLSRYAAADLYPPERRATGLSAVVWAGAIGGVAGPALLERSGRLASGFDLPPLTGAFIVAIAGCGLAFFAVPVFQRSAREVPREHEGENGASGARVFEMMREPRVRVALVSLAVAQTVMVLIMAMTPVHMRSHGHALGSVGLVIGLHVFGMYGLSPVSGRATDRFGAIPVVVVGFATLTIAALSAALSPDDAGNWLSIPLFLLGFGWSLTFVAGSALLTRGLAFGDRARLQGATDTVVWTAAAVAGLGSGVLVGVFGYAVLCVVGALLIVAPLMLIAGRRRTLAPVGVNP